MVDFYRSKMEPCKSCFCRLGEACALNELPKINAEDKIVCVVYRKKRSG